MRGHGSLGCEVDRRYLSQSGIRSVGLQGTGVFEEVQRLAQQHQPQQPSSAASAFPSPSPRIPIVTDPKLNAKEQVVPRFLRRRFQLLLGRLPVLSYSKNPDQTPTKKSGQYQVSLSPYSLHASHRSVEGLPEADAASLEWIQQADLHDKGTRSAAKKRRP